MLLDELAKDLVEVTSSLVGGRTINIMNTDGVIIASTDRSRIGSYHQGAMEALQTGKVVCIRRDQLNRYPGAKEGCNMPLRVNGVLIGVVGIYGDPDQIQDVAHLLEVYAAKYYQLEAMLRPRLSEAVLRSQLLSALLAPPEGSMSNIYGLMDRLHIQPSFPMTTAVISAEKSMSLPQQSEQLCSQLEQLGFLDGALDVWGIVDTHFVLVAGAKSGRHPERLHTLPTPENGYRISLGMSSASLWEVHRAYDQAWVLDQMSEMPICDITQLETRCLYMLGSTAADNTEFLDEMVKQFQKAFPPKEQQIMLESIACYYRHEHSVTAASEELFVHKNTLQYRVRRVLEELGLSKLPGFWQEYMIRLIIQRIPRSFGPQGLNDTRRPSRRI